jgi:hypothetical protein
MASRVIKAVLSQAKLLYSKHDGPYDLEITVVPLATVVQPIPSHVAPGFSRWTAPEASPN